MSAALTLSTIITCADHMRLNDPVMTFNPTCIVEAVDPVTCPNNESSSSSNQSDYAIIDSGERLVHLITSRFVPIVFCFISVVGIFGNIVVIAVALSSQLARNTTNVLIANLAIADLIFIVICVPFTAVNYAVPSWPFGNAWCKIYQYLIQATAYVSVYTLVLMSFDRYLAVVHPVRSLSIRTERNAYLVSGSLWTAVLIFNVPVLLENEQFDYEFDNELRSICINIRIYASMGSGDDYGRVYYGCFFVFAYALPLASICLLYGMMLKRLLRGTVSSCRRNPGAERMRSNKRVTRMVVIVVIVFALCWLPFHVVTVVQYFALGSMENASIVIPCKVIVTCVAYLNSCVNPVLYAFLSENFRRTFRRVVVGSHRKRRCKPHKSGEVVTDRPSRPNVPTSRGKEGLTMDVLPNA